MVEEELHIYLERPRRIPPAGDLTEEGRYDHQDRIVKLGHMLYALRTCQGFIAFIGSLKTRSLAPTFFELWVANILFTNGYEVTFVETTGVKGSDYDLIASRNGGDLYIEAKSRRDGSILDKHTLTNALTKARSNCREQVQASSSLKSRLNGP